MDDGLYALFAWLSPAYPVGAFSYSHGLEWAAETGQVRDRATLIAWIRDVLEHGAGRSDAVLLACAWRAARSGEAATLADLDELAEALAPSAERRLETMALGAAFAAVTGAAWGSASGAGAYPVALGAAAARHGIALDAAAFHFLQAFAANLVSAALRLGILGQSDGQVIVAELMPLCRSVATAAIPAGIEGIGGCAIGADIASMRHETQSTRLFRS